MSEIHLKNKADLKVVMVGDASVGKTCLVLRYIDRQFQESVSTIGAAFVLKSWGYYNIAIWDTAGGEKYAGLSTFYYRNASAAVLVFDIFDRKSFETLLQRYIPILNNVSSAKLKVVVGTKRDLLKSRERRVTVEEGINLAKSSNPHLDFTNMRVPYFETSSKTGTSVDDMFEYVFEHFFSDKGSHPRPQNTKIDSIAISDKIEKRQSTFVCCS
ncbi:ras-related protein Rab-20 [Parasteatoda tepidariorum]|uniref:ras-related protein Rab-20 n=1 Tax=Parasteatoda tepidariorum TaxID=114398 RepID=UPI00077FA65A|nr:ras-related protein Rab-20 [Parasteatoda tepidariorum]